MLVCLTGKDCCVWKLVLPCYHSMIDKIFNIKVQVHILFEQLTVLQGDIVKVQADGIVHPTSESFYMGGEVGEFLRKLGKTCAQYLYLTQ